LFVGQSSKIERYCAAGGAQEVRLSRRAGEGETGKVEKLAWAMAESDPPNRQDSRFGRHQRGETPRAMDGPSHSRLHQQQTSSRKGWGFFIGQIFYLE